MFTTDFFYFFFIKTDTTASFATDINMATLHTKAGRTGCVEQHKRVMTRIMFYKYCSKSIINHLQQSRQLIT